MNSPPADSPAPRRIRSFVRRAGRMTAGQERALQELWPRFGVDFTPAAVDLDAVFGRKAPRVLEIGFGNGDSLLALATANPDRDFLGIEVHEPGVGHVLLGAERAGLNNVRVSRHDAVEVLARQIPDAAFDEILIFFPDPWHKKRHHKRRLIQPRFVDLLVDKLRTGGVLRLATDWQDYAEQMLQVLDNCSRLRNCAAVAQGVGNSKQFVERPAMRPITRFERRGHRLGHSVWDLAFVRAV